MKSGMMEDVTGLALTSSNQTAVESFSKGLTAYVTLRENPVPFLKEALERDENLAIAHSVMVKI